MKYALYLLLPQNLHLMKLIMNNSNKNLEENSLTELSEIPCFVNEHIIWNPLISAILQKIYSISLLTQDTAHVY